MRNWADFGFSRVTAILPELKLGNPIHNAQLINLAITEEAGKGASVIFTPELALTGATCGDSFHSEGFLREIEEGLAFIKNHSRSFACTVVVGAPLHLGGDRLYSAAWVMQAGRIIGVVPKVSLGSPLESSERSWFVSGRNVDQECSHTLGLFPVSPVQVFAMGNLRIGIEFAQDLWNPASPSESLALKGANVILSMAASDESIGAPAFRKILLQGQSRKLRCGYFFQTAGRYEFDQRNVFSGHAFACETGKMLTELPPFHSEKSLSIDFDLEKILQARTRDPGFLEAVDGADHDLSAGLGHQGKLHMLPPVTPPITGLKRSLDRSPFLAELQDYEDLIQIQSYGLLREAQLQGAQKIVVGISEKLETIHAVYIALRTRALAGGKITVTGMVSPGAGLSEKMINLLRTLAVEAAVDEVVEVPGNTVMMRGSSGGWVQDASALIVGPECLTTLVLGEELAPRCHPVNARVSLRLIQGLVEYWSEIGASRILKNTLKSLLEAAATRGEFNELHEFFLYHRLKNEFSRDKIQALAEVAFAGEFRLLDLIPAELEKFICSMSLKGC